VTSTRWSLPVLGCGVLVCGVLAGCGASEPDTVAAQNVSACVASSASRPPGTPVEYEFRLAGKTVGRVGAPVDGAVSAQTPLGRIDVYADGEPLGFAESTGPSLADADGHPVGEIYLRTAGAGGCPDDGPHADDVAADDATGTDG